MGSYDLEIESHLEDYIQFEPERFKVWRKKDGSLFEVYDLELNGLWMKSNVGWLWLSNNHNYKDIDSWSEEGLNIDNFKPLKLREEK